MRRAALLIVLVIAGSPVGSLACELWCNSPAGEEHHLSVGCHEASGTVPPGPQIAFTSGCHDAAATTPFVTEVRQAASTPVATTPVAPFVSNSIGADNELMKAGGCVFNVPPERPPSSRPVLRV